MSPGTGAAPSARGAAFRAASLSYAYPGQPGLALDHLELACPRSSVLGLMGPNGSGKSTLLAVLATSLRPREGRLELLGRRPAPADRVRRRIATVFDASPFAEALSGRENLVRLLGLRGLSADVGRRRADRWLGRFGLEGRADDPVGTYSHGMRRKTDLAAAFAAEPELLLLDEPLGGLDAAARRTLSVALRDLVERGGAAVIAEHAPDFLAAACDEVAFLCDGRIPARGTPAELMASVDAATTVVVGGEAGSGGSTPDELPPGVRMVGRAGGDELRFRAPGSGSLPGICSAVLAAGWTIESVRVRRPDLDDAFLARTGRSASEASG